MPTPSRSAARRITTILSGTVITVGLVLGHAGGAEAKDAFCSKMPALKKAVDEIGNIDSKDLAGGFATFARGAKTFKDAESAAPSSSARASSAALRPLNNVFMPAIAVELAPGSNGVADLTSATYQQQAAAAIADAVVSVRDRLGIRQ